jgi:hypothetical protein
LVAFYLTMGQYDAVVINEAPDDQTVARLALAAAGRGNVRTETLRAFTENEAKTSRPSCNRQAGRVARSVGFRLARRASFGAVVRVRPVPFWGAGA